MKKIILFLFLLFPFFSFSNDFPYWSPSDKEFTENATSDVSEVANNQITEWWWVLDNILQSFWMWDHTQNDWSAVSYVQTVVNYFLIIVSFIALVVLIYGFYMMLFVAHLEEWFSKAKKYILNSTIALLVMWTSWFIVSFILYIVSLGVD